MGTRLELHQILLGYLPNVYFQPPSNIQMKYPCIVYSKSNKDKEFANDGVYKKLQGYQLMVIDKNPDSTTADSLEQDLTYCGINQYYVVDNLNHTTLNLYY